MQPADKAARVAGAWYLAMGLTGPLTLLYIPSKLIVRGDAAATAARILDHQTLFRVGIAAELIQAILFICAALALSRLFAGVNRTRAMQMVTFVAVSAGVGFLNTLNNVAALTLFRDGNQALGMLFVRLHGQGNVINEIFWGVWLLPLGLLVIQSGFLPKFIGVWLLINGAAYIALCFIGIFTPQYGDVAFKSAQPALFGELAFMLWLLIRGARPRLIPAGKIATVTTR